MLDNGASHNFIAAPQITKFSSNIQKSLLCPFEPMEVHLASNSSVISHQIVDLPLKFSSGAVHTIDSLLLFAFNQAKIVGMPLNFRIDWKSHNIT